MIYDIYIFQCYFLIKEATHLLSHSLHVAQAKNLTKTWALQLMMIMLHYSEFPSVLASPVNSSDDTNYNDSSSESGEDYVVERIDSGEFSCFDLPMPYAFSKF